MSNDPLVQFHEWFSEARSCEAFLPSAVALATADQLGRPSVRMVLLKGADHRGFRFFTHRSSRKGSQLTVTPFAALCFHWKFLERQVRVEGSVALIPEAEADEYWSSRPRGSQLGAWASDQSEVLGSLDEMHARMAAAEERFAGVSVPRPEGWVGYRLVPDSYVFWQGRPDRLHEVARFRAKEDGWIQEWIHP